MKITKKQLRKIIKEELQKVLSEVAVPGYKAATAEQIAAADRRREEFLAAVVKKHPEFSNARLALGAIYSKLFLSQGARGYVQRHGSEKYLEELMNGLQNGDLPRWLGTNMWKKLLDLAAEEREPRGNIKPTETRFNKYELDPAKRISEKD